MQLVAGDDGFAEAGFVDADEEVDVVFFGDVGQAEFFTAAFYAKDAGGLRHGLDDQYAGHDGFTGEVSLKEGFVSTDVFDGFDVFANFDVGDAVYQQEGVAVRQVAADFFDIHDGGVHSGLTFLWLGI